MEMKKRLRLYFLISFLAAMMLFIQGIFASNQGMHIRVAQLDLHTVPRNVTVNENTSLAYAAMYLNSSTAVVNFTSAKLVATIPTRSPYGISVNPHSNLVYVSQGEGPSIAVISGKTNKIVANISGAGTPYEMVINPKTNLLYASDPASNSLWVINGTSNQVVKRIAQNETAALALDAKGNKIYSAGISSNFSRGWVSIIDGHTNSLAGQVALQNPPGEMFFDSKSGTLLVLSAGAVQGTTHNTLYEIDSATLRVVGNVTVGNAPNLLTVNSAANIIYITDTSPHRLYALDVTTKQLILNASLTPGGNSPVGQPNGLAVNQLTGAVFLSQRAYTNLTMITLLPSNASSSSFETSTFSSTLTQTTLSSSSAVIGTSSVSTTPSGITSSSSVITTVVTAGKPQLPVETILAVVGILLLASTTLFFLRERNHW
jgi:DNA-binding beta-propeller fold protein YncE